MIWYGVEWYGMVWYRMVWCGMVWYGTVWYGMVWCGTARYGVINEWLEQRALKAVATISDSQTQAPTTVCNHARKIVKRVRHTT